MSRAHDLAQTVANPLLTAGYKPHGETRVALAELARLAADAERYKAALEQISAEFGPDDHQVDAVPRIARTALKASG